MQSILIRSIVEIMLLISINWAWAQGNYSQTLPTTAQGVRCLGQTKVKQLTYYHYSNGASSERATTMDCATYFYGARGESARRVMTKGNMTNGSSAGTAIKLKR